MGEVKGRVALVAGAANDIGEAVALGFARGGAKVAVVDREKKVIDDLVAKLKAESSEVMGIVADPVKSAEVDRAVEAVERHFGQIDILVNNVETRSGKSLEELSDDDWHASMQVNADPMFFFSRRVVPNMRARQHGRIINLGDLEYLGWRGKANYCASKSAIFGFTRSLALDLAKDNITVNLVAKGDLQTAGMSEEAVAEAAGRLPVKRLGTPDDIARAVAFFASDTSSYVTGQTLFVCGGKSIYCSMSI